MQWNRKFSPALIHPIRRLQMESGHADQIHFGNYFSLGVATGRSSYGPESKSESAGREPACKTRRTRYRRETAATDCDGRAEGAERDSADTAAERESRAAATAGHRTDSRAKGG